MAKKPCGVCGAMIGQMQFSVVTTDNKSVCKHCFDASGLKSSVNGLTITVATNVDGIKKAIEENKATSSSFFEKVKMAAKAVENDTDDVVRCPRCGSTQITANKKGFGAGKAIG